MEMIFKTIQDEITELWGFYLYDEESTDLIYAYLYEHYSGPTWAVLCSEAGDINVDADFKTGEDKLMFIMRHS